MAKKYKIQVIKLLMKNGKMADHGTVHEEGAFNRPVSDLVKEKFIEEATKSDIEAAKAKESGKEILEVESEEVTGSLTGDETKKPDEIKEDLLDPLKIKNTTAAKDPK